MNIFQRLDAERQPTPEWRTDPDDIQGRWRERSTGRIIYVVRNSPYFDNIKVCDITDSLAGVGPTKDAPSENKMGFRIRFEPYVGGRV